MGLPIICGAAHRSEAGCLKCSYGEVLTHRAFRPPPRSLTGFFGVHYFARELPSLAHQVRAGDHRSDRNGPFPRHHHPTILPCSRQVPHEVSK